MFKVLFLGTAASIPSAERNTTATLVTHGRHKFLIDMGEGTQRQMRIAGVGMRGLAHILLTHHHPDHVFGLGGLFFTLIQVAPPQPIHIFGNDKTLHVVDTIANLVWKPEDQAEKEATIQYHPLADGQVVFDSRDFTVSAFAVQHGAHESFGFKFEEKPTRKFLADKADALGVEENEMRGQLLAGKSITLASGRVVTPDEVLSAEMPGARLIVVGDCGYSESLIEHCQGADCLICEATFTVEHENLARERGHLTAQQAGQVAALAGVGQLYLNHRSQRYEDDAIQMEAQKVFPPAQVAHDFDELTVTARQ